jgi:hypothetical protein
VQEESTSAKGNAAPKAPPVAHENIIVGTRTDLFKPKDFFFVPCPRATGVSHHDILVKFAALPDDFDVYDLS